MPLANTAQICLMVTPPLASGYKIPHKSLIRVAPSQNKDSLNTAHFTLQKCLELNVGFTSTHFSD